MNLKYLANIRIPTERAHGYAIMKMCEQFSDSGLNVELIIPDKKNNLKISNPFEYYQIKNNFSITKVKTWDFLGLTKRFGFVFYWIDLFVFLVNLFFINFSPSEDIIYTRDFLLLLPFSGRNNNICLEVHELPNSVWIFKRLASKAKRVITLNSLLKEELIDLGIQADKIIIAGDAVDLEKFRINLSIVDAKKKLSFPVNSKMVLYTGHFYGWKGVGTLVEAAKILPEVSFVFVGGVDPDLSDFKNRFSNLNNLKIIPFQEHSLMPLYMAAADVLVLPNSAKTVISNRYTSPLKLFEYMAANRPIVASDLPSIREILNENNAILVEADNPQKLAEGIETALLGGNLINKIVASAYDDVQDHTWLKRASRIKDFILS